MKVFTFYSFKGGVGRTALMLHLGVHWADRGRVVAMVDMDLHAPGLSYHPWMEPIDSTNEYHCLGVSDLMATFYATRNVEQETFKFFSPSRALREIKPEGIGSNKWGTNGRLLVLPAGDVTIPQLEMIQGATNCPIPSATKTDDDSLEQQAMRAFARKFRQDFHGYRVADHPRKAGIDYLLIDCRTGYPELMELTMGYLADRLVLVSGLNQQNLQGLAITLQKLRPHRIPVWQYASETLVAFSPVPAHLFDDPEGRRALEAGVQVLADHRQDPEELLPPYFTLPYSPHLAVSDLPISRQRLLGRLHPYWEEVERIAEALDPQETQEESTQEIFRQTRNLVGLDLVAQVATKETAKEGNRIIVEIALHRRGSLEALLQLPKWHWPLAGDQSQINTWLRRRSIPKHLIKQRGSLLDGVCASISLTIAAKEQIIRNLGELSQFQIDSLAKIFHDEKLKVSTGKVGAGYKLMGSLFQAQLAWAEFMLGKEGGRKAFLLRPLQEPQLFASWQGYAPYWFLLADALEESPDAAVAARQKGMAVALANPWESLATLENHRHIQRDLAEQLLERLLSQPLSHDWDLCFALCDNVLYFWPGREMAEKITPIMGHLLAMVPDREETHAIHGRFLINMGQFQAAKEAYLRSFALNENSCLIQIDLGNLLQNHLGQYAEAEAAYRQAIAIDPKYVHAWNGLGLLYCDKLGRCQEALHYFTSGLDAEPNNPYPWINRGHLCLLLGQEWREDLERALAGFEEKQDLNAMCYRIFLALELDIMERLPSDPAIKEALSRWPQESGLRVMVAMRELAQEREIQPLLIDAAGLLRSHAEYVENLDRWYLLAGARPDLREGARQGVAFFFHLPPERLSQFKDIPQPARVERYRDFVEGRSHGAGDPRDRALFCHDAPLPTS